MPKYYAQIDDKGECIGVSQVNKEIIASGLIEIDELDDGYIGMTFPTAGLSKIPTKAQIDAKKEARLNLRKTRGWV